MSGLGRQLLFPEPGGRMTRMASEGVRLSPEVTDWSSLPQISLLTS